MIVFHNGIELPETEIYSYSDGHAHDMASRTTVREFVKKLNWISLFKIKFLAVGDTIELQLTSIGSGCLPTRITMCVSSNEEWLWSFKYRFLPENLSGPLYCLKLLKHSVSKNFCPLPLPQAQFSWGNVLIEICERKKAATTNRPQRRFSQAEQDATISSLKVRTQWGWAFWATIGCNWWFRWEEQGHWLGQK